MRRVTVLAADGPLGHSIVAEALSHELKLTAVASDPSRLAEFDKQIEVARGDLLDLTYPERLFENAEVVVFPFGSWDTGEIDLDADRHAAIALCRATERIPTDAARLVIVGRAAHDSDTSQQVERTSAQFEAVDQVLGELVTLGVFAAYSQFPWSYTSPYFSQSGARPHEFITMLQTHSSSDCSQMTRGTYLNTIIDSIEGRRGGMPFTASNSPLSSPISDVASAMVLRPSPST